MDVTTRYDVCWYGPFDHCDNDALKDGNLVLYMLCGTHGLYGKNVPLYIGRTDRTIRVRIREHTWINSEPDPVLIYAAAISPAFSLWAEVENIMNYPPPSESVINEIESLLIYAHQPVYNSRAKGGLQTMSQHIHVFNTGRRSTLYPELSSHYWYR